MVSQLVTCCTENAVRSPPLIAYCDSSVSTALCAQQLPQYAYERSHEREHNVTGLRVELAGWGDGADLFFLAGID